MTLASIQKIQSLEPIPGADRIVKATMEGLGWECVVMKDEFKVGDNCIYVEIDTIIPLNLLSGKDEDKDKRHRLRTIKLKGQLSQGLALPMTKLPDSYYTGESKELADVMGITKYEKFIPVSMQGLIKGGFPSFLPKTDEVRLQSDMKLLDQIRNVGCYFTKKMDGTSATYYKKDGVFGVCSRNLEIKEGDSIYWRVARNYGLPDLLPDNYAIQAELCGPGIQQNHAGLENFTLFIFNVFDLFSGCRKIAYPTNQSFADKLGVPFVPVFYSTGDLAGVTLENLLATADTLKYDNGHRAEGMVIRSWDQSISFKVVSNAYLLKEEE